MDSHGQEDLPEGHGPASEPLTAAIADSSTSAQPQPQPQHQDEAHSNPTEILSAAHPLVNFEIEDLRVDSQTDDDSALGGSSIASSTASVNSSVYEYVEEYGRRYHKFKAGRYMLPNDESEQDRLDMQHYIMNTAIGGLYVAPIKNLEGGIHNVLDIGTGTGIWALDFADEFPSANVIGIDLSPIQPPFVAPNCRFQIDDAEDPWLYSHKFDFIHGRALATCFKSHLTVFRQAYEFTRPGGYCEMQDGLLPFRGIDDSTKGTYFQHWMDMIMEGVAKLGKDWTRVAKYKSYFEEIGFEDVTEKITLVPIGRWAKGEHMKSIGTWAREDIISTLHGLSMPVLGRGMGMTPEQVEALLVDVKKDFYNPKIHIHTAVYVVYGRKPK